MFNPHQAQVWSELLAQNPNLDRFDGHAFEAALVRTVPAQSDARACEEGQAHAPERVFGTPVEPSCLAGVGSYSVRVSAPELRREANARVIGFCAVLTQAARLLAPHEITAEEKADFIARNAYNHQGFLFQPVEGGLLLRFGARETPRRFAGRALFLHNIEPGNYGSFIFRQLPQLLFAADQGVEPDHYIVGDRTPWLFEALQLAGLPRRPVFTVAEVCGDIFEELWIASGLDDGGYLSARTLSGLSAFKARALGGAGADPAPSGVPERVYVSRRLSALHRPWYRVMQNEAEVEDLLHRNGFAIVYPETLSLSDQVRVFSGARCVIGPSGSGMFNTAFAPESCRVLDIETFTYTVAQHAKFYSSCGHPYAFLFATPEPDKAGAAETPLIHRPYKVSTVKLLAALDWICAPA
jgi:capsular polysaccharide biosynthesis protein